MEPGSADTLVEIPVDWALDDWEQYAFYPDWTGSGVIESPTKAREMWQLEADAQHAQGGCWVLTNHPFISGRPSRARALEQLIEGVKALDGMWVTTLEEIARHAATATTEMRTHTRYDVPAFPDAPVLRDGVPVGGSGQARNASAEPDPPPAPHVRGVDPDGVDAAAS